MSVFNDTFHRAMGATASAHGTHASAVYTQNVNSAIDAAFEAIRDEADRVQNVDIKFSKGNIAEAYHAGTFNASAAAKGRADVSAEMMINNKPGQDIRYGQLDADERVAELKYYSTGEKTAKALDNPGYSSSDKVVPTDQLDEVRRVASRESLRNIETRPETSENYAHTAEYASDRLEYEDVTSKPLSNKEAIDLAKDLKSEDTVTPEDHGLDISEFVEWSDIAREAGLAALHAAAFSAALTAAPYLAKALVNGIKKGEIDVDTLSEGAAAVTKATPQAALRASVAAAIVSASQAGYCGEAMKEMSPHAVGMATAMVINSIGYSIKYAKGEMPGNEVALNCIKDSIALASGMLGASLGSSIIPIPVMGALIGNIVGSTIGAMAFQGVHSVTLGICVESGWTMFGLVDQDYQVPEDVLQRCGFDLIKVERINIQRFEPSRIHVQNIDVQRTGVVFLRRGVIGMSAVGYV
ncbi:hypothetical protein ACJO5Y_02060 [Marinobacter sp. GN3S48]|uniref:hypothetical protein n=1 Tax=Marinobacter sp. GN3S48 TaxID=3382302 RepID=UPI00387AF9EB